MDFVCLFVLLFYVPGNSYGHGGMVSSPNHTFLLGKLEQVDNQYFVHILAQPFLNDSTEGRRMTLKVWDWAGIEPATNFIYLLNEGYKFTMLDQHFKN